MLRKILQLIILLSPGIYLCQTDSNAVLRFDFNDQEIRESSDKIKIKPVGVTLTKDRFGNKNSAVYIHGHATSYLNLGSSNLLKPKRGTISMWVNIQAVVEAGRGYKANPFLIIRNSAQEDFNMAYGVGYSFGSKRMGVQQTKDSIKEVMVFSKNEAELGKWYHLVITSDDNHLALYIDGELVDRQIKGFESVFLEGDSVILGRSTGKKNDRYTHAIFDDLIFFQRVLTEKEIQALYHEPNPNQFKNRLYEFLKFGLIIFLLVVVIIVILLRSRKNLQKQKEHYELENKIKELEVKVIKTQMNPHFISNSLAAIQNLIYKGETDRASEYLAKFSFFLRQILEFSDRTYLTLAEELSVIRFNIELEQLRFSQNFSFKIEIEDGISLEDILIPSLITQPFIENAIWHGLLLLKDRDPKLIVRIYKNEKHVYISIEDNGVGRNLMENKGNKKSHGTKLAVDKIESINRLTNSTEYKLEIIDLLDEKNEALGTKVVIQLSADTLDA